MLGAEPPNPLDPVQVGQHLLIWVIIVLSLHVFHSAFVHVHATGCSILLHFSLLVHDILHGSLDRDCIRVSNHNQTRVGSEIRVDVFQGPICYFVSAGLNIKL